NWLRVQAVATAAAARAARGGVDAADRALADAAVGAPPDVARWYERARLLLADAAGRAAPPLPAAADRDTSGPGLITYGLWAARPTRMPGSAFELRGLVFPFGDERMARLAERLGVRADARRHWSIVLATLTHPDPDLAPTVAEARRARASLQ